GSSTSVSRPSRALAGQGRSSTTSLTRFRAYQACSPMKSCREKQYAKIVYNVTMPQVTRIKPSTVGSAGVKKKLFHTRPIRANRLSDWLGTGGVGISFFMELPLRFCSSGLLVGLVSKPVRPLFLQQPLVISVFKTPLPIRIAGMQTGVIVNKVGTIGNV